ncbi:replication initiation protein RepC 2 (plasmid) [Rhizobium etli bv. mimosae str. IE4771]|uniref:Replication initiation protein RepC 2 n=1 Tax=Rhizobium etli bv. mimosae str. IE4771 TaxID=1432050 RepID=A0A060I8J0_RHIET|nr:plasmid replication protein RepC [Rhizobium sp. IE4771]AIC30127.1 replication initiation protein RepC 2 [Rhizobium sp. IE4771]
MQLGSVTTPFGRRPITLALVRRQAALAEIKQGKTADKWKVFRDASAAMELLGIQSNSLAVLDALLSFYPHNELRQDKQLIVFPSNAQLAIRAHAMAGATLRRHIAILVEAGLIVRKDSANGKRYARKGDDGQIENAFGFDLSPLLARSEELAMLAQRVAADRAALRQAKQSLTICRRDVRKLITAAMEEGADGDWQAVEDFYIEVVSRIPRAPTLAATTAVLDEMQMLRDEVLNRLENREDSRNNSTNAAHSEQHIQNSNSESSSEFEPRLQEKQGAKSSSSREPRNEQQRAVPLGLVLKACPTISDYALGGIGSWRELMSAAVVVRSMLGVSPSAYQDACETLGPENAAVAIACILERAHFINSPGGYLRDLTRRSERGEFSLGSMIMALLRANGQGGLKAG